MTFYRELEALINRYNMEKNSSTPDYVLATFLQRCLSAFDIAANERDRHRGVWGFNESDPAKIKSQVKQ